LLGVAKFTGEVREADVGVAQVAFGGVTAHAVDELGESGAVCGETAVQRLRVQVDLGRNTSCSPTSTGRIPVARSSPSASPPKSATRRG
jgi:hypothetical protein